MLAPFVLISRPITGDIAVWSTGLELGTQTAQDLDVIRGADATTPSDIPLHVVIDHLPQYTQLLGELESELARARLLKLGGKQPMLEQRVSLARSWISALAPLLHKKTQWIILLENDNELRATGGFMGSYALVTIENETISEITIEDIYDADGQFTGFFPAPAGAREYLSGGNGLRLPDANWSPDFPTSATQVLGYFALGKRQDISGVLAVTNGVIAQLLQITGPLKLPDYDTEVTADTIDSVLQNRPQAFFPGSIQKKHLLSQTKNQFFMALAQLTPTQWQQVFSTMQDQLVQKNILLYSLDPKLQQMIEAAGWDGSLQSTTDQPLFLIIESNVGINKSNQWQDRAVALDFSTPSQLVATITYTNHAPTEVALDQGRYVNYLRAVTPPDWQIQNVVVDDVVQTTQWQTVATQSTAGVDFAETGGLIVVPPQATKTVVLTFAIPVNLESLVIGKQPGLPKTKYNLITEDGARRQFVLDQDLTVSLH